MTVSNHSFVYILVQNQAQKMTSMLSRTASAIIAKRFTVSAFSLGGPYNIYTKSSNFSSTQFPSEVQHHNGPNPLSTMKENALKNKLCDSEGYRLPDTHWAFIIAGVCDGDFDEGLPPSVRTVNFLRVSKEGIDFVTKRRSNTAKCILSEEKPVSFLYTLGKYQPGEHVVQYRASGICEQLPIEEILDKIPEYTLTEIVASKRARLEAATSSETKLSIEGKQARFTEIVQQTRSDFASGSLSLAELSHCIQHWRFLPEMVERMEGGPDEIMWSRFQYVRDEKTTKWKEPIQMMPF